ncbi:MAG: arginyltransferase [Rhodospirillales bacterium]|nr:arginyltransferase [Rhodospirillales bacterium]
MKHRLMPSARFFFVTAPLPCPYLPGRFERRLVTELAGRQTSGFHDALSRAGFRRSHGIAYVPVCRGCNACAAVRVLAGSFSPNRTQRRIDRRNADLSVTEVPARATHEQFALFRSYQQDRHTGGEMSRMDFCDFQTLVEDTPVDTVIHEVRGPDGTLLGACLTDRMTDGFSAVYSFFDSRSERSSLGSFMILWLIKRAQTLSLPYVYLGFWVADCAKMAYKSRFQPLEAYTSGGWQLLDVNDPKSTRPFRINA